MLITVRELNAFGNILYNQKKFSLAKEMHKQVLRLLEMGEVAFDMETETEDGKELCRLIKQADDCIRFLNTHRKFAR